MWSDPSVYPVTTALLSWLGLHSCKCMASDKHLVPSPEIRSYITCKELFYLFFNLGIVAHTFTPSRWISEFQDSQGYKERFCLKNIFSCFPWVYKKDNKHFIGRKEERKDSSTWHVLFKGFGGWCYWLRTSPPFLGLSWFPHTQLQAQMNLLGVLDLVMLALPLNPSLCSHCNICEQPVLAPEACPHPSYREQASTHQHS